ncbi:hypothetical protein EJ04DRAFT_408422, partial [Polyplosphaeria fusca]
YGDWVKPLVAPKKPLWVNRSEAHRIWGHASAEAIEHLPEAVEGLELIPGGTVPGGADCSVCVKAKLMQIISRRPPTDPVQRPFYRVLLDLVQLL